MYKKREIHAKKSLGQNFLIDENIALKIVRASAVIAGDSVVEVGAGTGELTQKLLDTGAGVFAIEIDRSLCRILEERFGERDNFHLMHADILKLGLRQLGLRKKVKLIGNLPFNISSQIIGKFLPELNYIQDIFVTVQKELGERLVSYEGLRQSSAFSLFVRFYSTPKALFNIKRTCFWPTPEVDASFLKLSLRSPDEKKDIDTQMLFAIIRTAFSQRRKTVFNALRKAYEPQGLRSALKMAGVEASRRPETIKLDKYIKLMNSLKQLN